MHETGITGWQLRTYSVRRASQAAPSTIWTDLSHAHSAPKRDQGLGGQLQTNHCILSLDASSPSSQNQWIRSSKPHLFNYSPRCFSNWTQRICKFVKTTQKNHCILSRQDSSRFTRNQWIRSPKLHIFGTALQGVCEFVQTTQTIIVLKPPSLELVP